MDLFIEMCHREMFCVIRSLVLAFFSFTKEMTLLQLSIVSRKETQKYYHTFECNRIKAAKLEYFLADLYIRAILFLFIGILTGQNYLLRVK